jgi:predicted HAD superfamily Cof-like phosphohydrolase
MNDADKLQDCKKRLTAVLSDHQRLTHEALFNRKEIGMAAVRRMMQAANQPPSDFSTALLYRELVREEYDVELNKAWDALLALRTGTKVYVEDGSGDLLTVEDAHIAMLDAIADTIVTLQGLAEGLGYDLVGGYNEVMNSNLSKIQTDGTVHKRPDGKILKPTSYRAPVLIKYIGEQA